MTEAARKVAQQAEERLDEVAKNVRERFDRVTEGRLTDKAKNGTSADRAGQGRNEARRREQGGPEH
ncbi:hypothetical protein DER29_2253 [Micromonospora sp. M71_S20]|uniref:hypothetical protein n=1 Tax=Micromonospora sp. M71_S20 TaxID=592872 RepID=UPI000EB53406|nr:hypothetical protein [Micromonospora sp. M71_S20]RLK24350.1 hypothetical protein DER29_2253 [Micromonospora sp. M71_S20]